MKQNKVIPNAGGLYWGTPQVIRLNQHCTGTPHEAIYPYPKQHKIMDNGGVKQRLYNTLMHCRVQLAEQRYTNVGLDLWKTLSIHWPSYCCLMHPPHCHGWPEIHIRLTLDVGQRGPVILGGEGCGNNSFQTMLVHKQKSRAIVENSLHPLAIILLPNAPPPLPWVA
jgi:hypothetical protein